ncbi:MAG: hypothetical protein SVK08_02080 [Halobacteriota archaeon]|nr:hypothetical protein [Halobacteriota archaeon]
MIIFTEYGKQHYFHLREKLPEEQKSSMNEALILLELREEDIQVGGKSIGCTEASFDLTWLSKGSGKAYMHGGLVMHENGEWSVNT